MRGLCVHGFVRDGVMMLRASAISHPHPPTLSIGFPPSRSPFHSPPAGGSNVNLEGFFSIEVLRQALARFGDIQLLRYIVGKTHAHMIPPPLFLHTHVAYQ